MDSGVVVISTHLTSKRDGAVLRTMSGSGQAEEWGRPASALERCERLRESQGIGSERVGVGVGEKPWKRMGYPTAHSSSKTISIFGERKIWMQMVAGSGSPSRERQL